MFDQALEGGGAKNINFQELAADLAQITFDYPFRIPPYFALIIRAIGVLEGIALVGGQLCTPSSACGGVALHPALGMRWTLTHAHRKRRRQATPPANHCILLQSFSGRSSLRCDGRLLPVSGGQPGLCYSGRGIPVRRAAAAH